MVKLLGKIKDTLVNMRLGRKIQFSFLLVIIPLFIVFMVLFVSMYSYSQQYDRNIANATMAGQFSIDFRDEFDNTIYLIIVGNTTFEEAKPYDKIDEARSIISRLSDNTSISDNRQRAKSMLNMLDNLETYVSRIEDNKHRIGDLNTKVKKSFYYDSIDIWENDVQSATILLQYTMLEYTYYETIGLDRVRTEMSESLGNLTFISLMVLVLLIVTAILLSIIIPKSIAKPIYHLNDVTNQVAKGDLTARVKNVHGAEVSKLGESLNSMIEKIQILLHAVETDQAKLRAAELELLQAQINPHFLYNTLDTIIWLAESGKQQQVVDMVGSLSDFFRTSLNHGNGMFTLREEERHVRSYMQIQQVRYQDILEYEIDIPDLLKDALIPKITLQPLVENALYHGIKNRRSKGSISIFAHTEGDDVVISVKDSGIGMTPERLKTVIERMEEKGHAKHEVFGLYNVNERIKLKFGRQYGLSITSVHGKGTCVQVKIPIKLPNR